MLFGAKNNPIDGFSLIDVNEVKREVRIFKYTDNMMFRAFGVVENPDFEMYQEFLESRCFPKTICFDFDEQLDIAEALYGDNLKFTFMKQDVQELLNEAVIYTKEERERVERIINAQMYKYTYLF